MLNKFKETPAVPAILDQSYLPSLDGLRAISIIMVVFSHIFFVNKNLAVKIFSGDLGVHVFFVISGFLITTLLLKERSRQNSISLKKFYIRRFLRIFPVAYLFLLVVLILNSIFELHITRNAFISSSLYIRNTSILPSTDWQTGHFWSLSVEEQFYLLFPFLLTRNLRAYIVIVVVLIFIIPVVVYANVHYNHTIAFTIFTQLIKSLTGILVGSLFAILFFYRVITEEFVKKPTLLINLLLLGAAAIIESNLLPLIPSSVSGTISSVLIVLIIITNIKVSTNFFFRFLNLSFVKFIGVLSYSMYVWQQLFTFSRPWAHLFPGSDSVWLNMLVLFIVSYCSYHYYEKKFLRLKNRFEVKR